MEQLIRCVVWQEPTLMSYLMECFQGNYDSFRTIQLPNNRRKMNVYLFPDCSITFSRRNIGALLNSEISKVAKSVKIEYPISSSILLKVSGHLWGCFENKKRWGIKQGDIIIFLALGKLYSTTRRERAMSFPNHKSSSRLS